MLSQNHAIIRARFLDQWGTTIPVMYDFGPAQERPKGLHVHYSIKPTGTTHRAGDRRTGTVESFGRVWLTVYAPQGTAEKAMSDALDKFAKIYRNWQSADFAIDFETESFGATGIDPATNNLFAQVSVFYRVVRRYSTDI